MLSGFVNLENPQRGIAAVVGGGFDKIVIDMAMSYSARELEIFGHPGKLCNSFRLLLEQCQKDNIRIPVARAPYLHRSTERGGLGELLSILAKESIKVCKEAGCSRLIVKPLFAGAPLGREWEVNQKYYLGLVETARENDIVILLENQCRDVNGHLIRGVCSDADEAAAWIDRLNKEAGEECFGFCMDVGACSLCGQNMQEFAVSLGERIKAVILRDCNGHNETSMLPFTSVGRGSSQTDWLGLIRGLREICFNGALIMDLSSTVAAFSPLIRPQLLQLAKTTAEYLKWQIGMKSVLKKYDTRVVFGAGNMCRNYMKCYGKEFPPLFTCDNNKFRWGEWFEGLKIRPPEALKELDKDCAIFICNIYYKEIERQLRDMGLRNPIEFFNDEYMPSYYFDRLDYWEGEGQ
jgi:sugar phosphate isomerase/epimerase